MPKLIFYSEIAPYSLATSLLNNGLILSSTDGSNDLGSYEEKFPSPDEVWEGEEELDPLLDQNQNDPLVEPPPTIEIENYENRFLDGAPYPQLEIKDLDWKIHSVLVCPFVFELFLDIHKAYQIIRESNYAITYRPPNYVNPQNILYTKGRKEIVLEWYSELSDILH